MADTDKLVKVGQLDAVADAVIEVVSDTNGRLDILNGATKTIQLSRHFCYKNTTINTSTKQYTENNARAAFKPLYFPFSCVIESAEKNIAVFSDKEDTWTAVWTDKYSVQADETVYIVVKDTGGITPVPATNIDAITITGSKNDIETWISNNYFTPESTASATVSSLIEQGWVAIDEQTLGMIQRNGEASSRRLSKPIYISKASTIDLWALSLPNSQVAHFFINNELVDIPMFEHKKISVPADTFVDIYIRHSYLNARWNVIPIEETFQFTAGSSVMSRLAVTLDTAVVNGNYLYTASYRDNKIRVFDFETMSELISYDIDSSHIGHANSSSFFNNKWYISDLTIPNLVHVFSIDGQTVTYERDITMETTLASDQLVVNSNINAYGIGVDIAGDYDNSKVIVEQYAYNSSEYTYEYVREVGKYPRNGHIQGSAIYNNHLLTAVSRNDSSYAMRALLDVNLLTGEITEYTEGVPSTEIEAVVSIDSRSVILFGVNGDAYYYRY